MVANGNFHDHNMRESRPVESQSIVIPCVYRTTWSNVAGGICCPKSKKDYKQV